MNKITTALSAAALASSLIGTAAWSADKAGASDKAVPSQAEVQQKGTSPSVKDLDANAQRAHDPSTGSGADSSMSKDSGSMSKDSSSAGSSGATRDWAAVDKNHDNLIQPEEMEAALKEVGPQAGKKR